MHTFYSSPGAGRSKMYPNWCAWKDWLTGRHERTCQSEPWLDEQAPSMTEIAIHHLQRSPPQRVPGRTLEGERRAHSSRTWLPPRQEPRTLQTSTSYAITYDRTAERGLFGFGLEAAINHVPVTFSDSNSRIVNVMKWHDYEEEYSNFDYFVKEKNTWHHFRWRITITTTTTTSSPWQSHELKCFSIRSEISSWCMWAILLWMGACTPQIHHHNTRTKYRGSTRMLGML